MVVLASEFGRTPDIDEDNGRNHYPKAFSALLAGGGVRGGQRYGKTDKEGREPDSEPTSIPDLNATIALTKRPHDPVTVNFTGAERLSTIFAEPAALVFAPDEWDVAQPIRFDVD